MNLFNLFRHPPELKDLTPNDIESALEHPSAPVMLDVRTTGEFKNGHISGAKSYPLGNEERIIVEYPKDKSVILICKTGHRSQAAAIALLQAGFTDVSHLKGGMNTWVREGKPVSRI